MTMRTIKTVLLGLALLGSTSAMAITPDEVMNMVNVNVPTNIVIETMKSSGTTFTEADIARFRQLGAPADILAAAQGMMGAAAPAPATTAPAPVPQPGPVAPVTTPMLEDDEGGMLGGDLGGLSDSDNEAPAEATGPELLEQAIDMHKKKKYLSSSLALYTFLQENRFPQYEAKILYYLAKNLYEMEHYHGAQHYFMLVVRKGPNNPYFKYALPRLVAIAQYTGNDYELLRIVGKIPPEAFPRRAKDHLNYLMGRKAFERGDLSKAASYFTQVASNSDLYMRSKYYEGVINADRGKYRSAVKAFRDVYNADPGAIVETNERLVRDVENLKDLSLINIARIYFKIERFENADNYYGLVDRNSDFWPESLFERAWTTYYLNDTNHSLGLLLTANSPYYADHQFIPETTVLRALAFWTFCEYDEVDRLLGGFEAEHEPMKAELKAFLEQYKSEQGQQLADQAFDAYFAKDHSKSTLPKAMFSRVLRNQDLSALVYHLDMMDEEISKIEAANPQWRDTLGDEMKKMIEADRQRYKKRAGLVLLSELQKQYATLTDLLSQSAIIRFEVVDAKRVDYEFKMSNPDVESLDEKKIDFATSKDIIYWPFNGEFWKDELGYYRYTEKGSCK